jgi:hypothetical protein
MATVDPAPHTSVDQSARIRRAIYIATAIASILVTYGTAKGWHWLGEAELAAWGSIVALVNGLAAYNVQTNR